MNWIQVCNRYNNLTIISLEALSVQLVSVKANESVILADGKLISIWEEVYIKIYDDNKPVEQQVGMLEIKFPECQPIEA